VWDQVLASSLADSDAQNEALGERAWSLFSAGEMEQAREGLQEVVDAMEDRKKVRAEEQKAKEKARSKAGVERGKGVEEGETSVEAEERAKSWYRLGECLWALGGESSCYGYATSLLTTLPTHRNRGGA
jgi:superkiller protein 3